MLARILAMMTAIVLTIGAAMQQHKHDENHASIDRADTSSEIAYNNG